MTWMATAEVAAVDDMIIIATCSLTAGDSVNMKPCPTAAETARMKRRTVERTRVEEPPDALRREQNVHAITEPV